MGSEEDIETSGHATVALVDTALGRLEAERTTSWSSEGCENTAIGTPDAIGADRSTDALVGTIPTDARVLEAGESNTSLLEAGDSITEGLLDAEATAEATDAKSDDDASEGTFLGQEAEGPYCTGIPVLMRAGTPTGVVTWLHVDCALDFERTDGCETSGLR